MVAAWTVGRILLAEALHRRAQPRLPGTVRAAMDERDQVTPAQVLSVALAEPLIRPGDRVLELGCGRGGAMMALAKLHPEARFVGLDGDEGCVDAARAAARTGGVTNVRWLVTELNDLDRFADDAFDVIVSSFALHQLSATRDLRRCMVHLRRILSRGGRIGVADFVRPRSSWSMQALARVAPATLAGAGADLLRAAFTAEQLHHVAEATGLMDRAHARHHVARPVPLIQVIQSPPTGDPTPEFAHSLARLTDRLSEPARQELDTLARLLLRGGVDTALAASG